MPIFVKNYASLALMALIYVLSFVAIATPGQPGTLDTTWAASSSLGAGKVITPIASGAANDEAYAVVLQPDGKVVLAGACTNAANTSTSFCALRYNAIGSVDTSFGVGGSVATVVSNQGANAKDFANAAILQSDGKLVLAGRCYMGNSNANGLTYDFCAARYLANGALDSTFGNGGKVITSLGVQDHVATAIAMQPDGKLVLAGDCAVVAFFETHFCAVRYLANGVLDTSFNGTGKVITSVSAKEDRVVGLAVLPDGKLVLGGTCFSTTSNRGFCALRYLANGTVDLTFGGSNTGKVSTPIGTVNDRAGAMALQPDGKLILAGYCYVTNGFNGENYKNICALRYGSNGVDDLSFSGGKFILPAPVAGYNEAIAAISVQPDGKILMAGPCDNRDGFFGGVPDFCSLRFNDDGALDNSFGGTGKVVTKLGDSFNTAAAAALQVDGKLVVAGNCYGGFSSGVDFCALRYDGGPFGYQSCKPDLDGDGTFSPSDALIYARVALGINGNAVIGGVTFPAAATRKTWPLLRTYLVLQCGLNLGP